MRMRGRDLRNGKAVEGAAVGIGMEAELEIKVLAEQGVNGR